MEPQLHVRTNPHLTGAIISYASVEIRNSVKQVGLREEKWGMEKGKRGEIPSNE